MSEENQNVTTEGCSKESCEGCPSAGNCPSANGGEKPDFYEELNAYSSVKHVIGVVSGKGGVGKSFVTAAMAAAMRKQGYEVGILDADITGPSIPKMFGVKGPAMGNEMGIMPVVAEDGTKIMSLNLLVDDEESPVIWRGPVLAGTVKQFWHDVCWGNVDYMFVDMPPGTGDVPLTVFQSLPVDGIVIVTSPQELVQMIVKKAVNMANMMNVPILGVIENYSFIKCPDCGKEIAVFGKSNIEEVAKASNMEVLGKLPLDPSFAEKADCGRFFDLDISYLSKAYDTLKAL